MKNNKGITLISLIITIIILVILAGVTITTLVGENGILNKSKEASEKYIEEQVKEKITLAILDIQTQLRENEEINMQALIEYLPQKLEELSWNEDVTNETEEPEGKYKGYNFKIEKSFNMIITGKEELNKKNENAEDLLFYASFDSIKLENKNIKFDTLNEEAVLLNNTVKKNGTSSCQFLGQEGQALTLANSELKLGVSDFTIQFWTYPEKQTMPYSFFCGSYSNNNLNIFCTDQAGDINIITVANGLQRIIVTNSKYKENQWTHYALVRKNGVFTLYENGKNIGATSDYKTIEINLSDFAIGGNSSTNNTAYKGYIADIEIYNKALYDSDFEKIVNEEKTRAFYAKFDNYESQDISCYLKIKAIKNNLNGKNIILLDQENINISKEKNKIGGGSCYFNGTISQALKYDSSELNFGTNDFTIEFWAYPEQQTMPYSLFCGNYLNDNLNIFCTDQRQNRKITVANGGERILITNSEYKENEWTHYALVRKDGEFTLYENGINIGTTSNNKTIEINLPEFAIGGNSSTVNTAYKGYIDDFAIYNKAIYTQNFEPRLTAANK